MADGWDDDWQDYFAEETPDWKEIVFGTSEVHDQHAQELFQGAFFDNNDTAYIDLVDYMWREYNIDFEAEFEWQDFREWYESQ